eukprot:2771749-Ditylum_brightwellii.AAC.1
MQQQEAHEVPLYEELAIMIKTQEECTHYKKRAATMHFQGWKRITLPFYFNYFYQMLILYKCKQRPTKAITSQEAIDARQRKTQAENNQKQKQNLKIECDTHLVQ